MYHFILIYIHTKTILNLLYILKCSFAKSANHASGNIRIYFGYFISVHKLNVAVYKILVNEIKFEWKCVVMYVYQVCILFKDKLKSNIWSSEYWFLLLTHLFIFLSKKEEFYKPSKMHIIWNVIKMLNKHRTFLLLSSPNALRMITISYYILYMIVNVSTNSNKKWYII